MIHLSSVAVKCDGSKCDGAGCLVLSRGLMYCRMFREQIWSPCSMLRKFSLITFLKVSGMPLICPQADFEKTLLQQGRKGNWWRTINLDSSFPLAIGSI